MGVVSLRLHAQFYMPPSMHHSPGDMLYFMYPKPHAATMREVTIENGSRPGSEVFGTAVVANAELAASNAGEGHREAVKGQLGAVDLKLIMSARFGLWLLGSCGAGARRVVCVGGWVLGPRPRSRLFLRSTPPSHTLPPLKSLSLGAFPNPPNPLLDPLQPPQTPPPNPPPKTTQSRTPSCSSSPSPAACWCRASC